MKFVPRAVVIAITLLVAAVPSLADAAPNWPAARIVLLPAGAKGVPQGYLPALSCASAGNCVAGGAYTDAKGETQGLLSDEINGAWRGAVTITPPSTAATSADVTVLSTSCGAPGNCSAVGTYQDKSGASQGFVDSEVGNVWRGALSVALPANAVNAGQDVQLRSVACASAGNCSVVGTYAAVGTHLATTQGLVLNEVNGTWQKAQQVHLPGATNVNPFVVLNQVACAGAGNCSAVGSYIDSNGATHGLVVNESATRWAPGQSLLLPGNASPYPDASLSAVTCVAPGTCSAIGNYENTSGVGEGLVVSQSSHVWRRATAMVMPTGARTNPDVFFYGFNAISCSSATNCSAGGQYTDSTNHYQGFLVSEVNGVWQGAVELKLPTDGTQVGKNGGVVALSCRSSGDCSAGAAYLDASGFYQALVINEVNGTWQTGTKVTLPAGATSVGVDGGVYGLVCQSPNICTASGSYQRSTTVYEGFTLTVN
ncbi:MAG: hypothetical protein ABSG24_08620 [Acidimicrobiales bacterium]